MKMPLIASSGKSGNEYLITHYPRLVHQDDKLKPMDPVVCERLLSDWFGHPVILLSSGRVGINLALKAMGFHMYRNKLRVPPFLSTCVLNAITPVAFPVELTQKADGMMWYHQYGFPQRSAPESPNVIEDCAHSFFSTPSSGERDWVGDVAIFSLPKFFNIAGMAGGIIVRDAELEEKIRLSVADAHQDVEDVRTWMRRAISSAFDSESSDYQRMFINSAYELLLEFIKPNSNDLAGFPSAIEEIREIGRQRRERIEFIVDYFGKSTFPDSFLDGYEGLMPFAMPCFYLSDKQMLENVASSLSEAGIHAGIYQVDVNRNYRNPAYKPCILLPCHQNVPFNRLQEACAMITSCR